MFAFITTTSLRVFEHIMTRIKLLSKPEVLTKPLVNF